MACNSKNVSELDTGNCDVWNQYTCPDDMGCIWEGDSNNGSCYPSGNGLQGGECSGNHECLKGFQCIDNSCSFICQVENPQCGIGLDCIPAGDGEIVGFCS